MARANLSRKSIDVGKTVSGIAKTIKQGSKEIAHDVPAAVRGLKRRVKRVKDFVKP